MSFSELQKKITDESNKTMKMNSDISGLRSELLSSQKEFEDYKIKAGRILQSKDKLISDLKEGRVNANITNSETDLILAEMEQVKGERDLLREELESCNNKVKQLTNDLTELEILSQNESRNGLEALSALEHDLATERRIRGQTDDENKQTKQELKCAHEELKKQKISFSKRLQERDEEIQGLYKQIAHKQSSSSSQIELENRLKGLTESLIHKQTTIETLSTEKQSLFIQLERLQNQYKESQDMLNKSPSISFGQDETRNRVPAFLVESPFDGKVTRRVKKVYSTLDKFSVRLGVFLRRYPIARVFVIIYMLLLHVWVMIVLLTYTPEVHGPDFHKVGTAPQYPLKK